MKPNLFGHCVTGHHHLCRGVLPRPHNQVATCTCDCHKEKQHDPDDR